MSEKVSFEPTKEQIKFLEIYLELGRKTNEEIAKEIGICDRTIYRWFNNDDFVKWLNSFKDKLLNKSLMSRYVTAIRKADAGDFNFSKMLFEMQREYVQRSETKVTNTYSGYDDMTDEEIINGFKSDLDRFRAVQSRRTDTKINTTKET